MLPLAARLSPLVAVSVAITGLLLGDVAITDPEVARLRAHFAQVERELLARDVADLSPAQRAARAAHVERLRAYAAAGVFPRNTDFPGRYVPYFVDRVGTRCAMAHLIEEGAGADLVARVAATNNNAYIPELARDPALVAWLDRNGLSLAEAARIQPAYCEEEGWALLYPCPEPPRASTGYEVATVASVVAGLSTLTLNTVLLAEESRTAGWLGVTTGILGLGLGVAHVGDDGEFSVLAPLNLVVGGAAVWSGLRALRKPSGKAAPPAAVRAAPWFGAGGAGLQVHVRF